MAEKSIVFLNFLLLLLLLLQLNLGLVEGSRKLNNNIHPPAIATTNSYSFKSPKAPSSYVSYSTNTYKVNEEDAFRPTTPGHSPGMGHDVPPGARA